MSTTIDENELRSMLKAAVAEALEEHRALLKQTIEEAFEDIALARAIDEGMQSLPASRDEVFHTLENEQ